MKPDPRDRVRWFLWILSGIGIVVALVVWRAW